MDSVLEISNLHTYFETRKGTVKAVNGVSLSLERGKVQALVGESGCGKSMTALSILKLVPEPGRIVSGEIRLFSKGEGVYSKIPSPLAGEGHLSAGSVAEGEGGLNLLNLSESKMRTVRGNRIAMIFQEPMTSLNPVYTVGNQIAEAILLHQNVNKKEARTRAVDMLKKVGIPNPDKRVNDYPHQMSGGMRQRVMIAMALSCNPELLIADEPTTALDVTIQAQILELMAGLIREFGMSLLLITHDLGIVAEQAYHVAVMYAGKIVELATVREIFAHPRHPYTKGLLDSIPRLKKGEKLRAIPGTVPDLSKLPPGCAFADRCERVRENCRRDEPQLVGPKGDEHLARCFYPHNG